MMSEPVLRGIPDLEVIVFQWSRKHGDCIECGLPAAFADESGDKLCAVCAANRAADGEVITRIDPIG